MTADGGIEARALRRSLLGYLVFGGLGVGFSILTGSNAILLDGVYSLVCAAVAVAAMQVSQLVTRPDDESHPFGYAKYEPLLNALKGGLILVLCVVSAGGSIETLLRGGREPAFGWAIVYSVICTTGCFVMAAAQRRSARATGSALLTVEARSWVFDGAISGGVGVAFVIAAILERTPLAGLVPSIDPAMTLLLVAVLLPVPFGTVAGGMRELLFQSPAREENERLAAICREELAGLALGEPRLRRARIGRTVYVMVSYLLTPDDADPSVADLDAVRGAIGGRIRNEGIAPIVYVDVLVTRRAELV
jgi:predicted Co/Zn/Cd cation transporter (cation efflux family)